MQVKSVYDQLAVSIKNMKKQLKDLENLLGSSSSRKTRHAAKEVNPTAYKVSPCIDCKGLNKLHSNGKAKLLRIPRMARSVGKVDGQLKDNHELSSFRLRKSLQKNTDRKQPNGSSLTEIDLLVMPRAIDVHNQNRTASGEISNENTTKSQTDAPIFAVFDVSGNQSFHIK